MHEEEQMDADFVKQLIRKKVFGGKDKKEIRMNEFKELVEKDRCLLITS